MQAACVFRPESTREGRGNIFSPSRRSHAPYQVVGRNAFGTGVCLCLRHHLLARNRLRASKPLHVCGDTIAIFSTVLKQFASPHARNAARDASTTAAVLALPGSSKSSDVYADNTTGVSVSFHPPWHSYRCLPGNDIDHSHCMT